ncbi:MAG: tRNA 2-thiouridine synthesizing protein C [Alteromonadaceae bacterium]|jgi:tRNA 2-thiouridine synthesizing protein C
MKKIAIINTQSSFNLSTARESLDLALIFGAFEQQVAVIFIDDGVYQLIDKQNPELLGSKDYLSTMKAFELYDIEQIIASQDDLSCRGIANRPLSMDVELLSNQQIAQCLTTFDHVITM